MATSTLYDFNYTTPVQVTREEHINVGSGVNILGDVSRGFKNGLDFEIWTAASGGTQLTESTDYDLVSVNIKGDTWYSNESGYTVISGFQITNATYQTGSIFITYKVVGSYTDATFFNTMRTEVDTNITDIAVLETQIPTANSKMVLSNGGFWGEVLWKDANEIIIKPKQYNGKSFIGAILNDGTYLELTSDYTMLLDVPGSSGHIIDGITAVLNDEWYRIVPYEDSTGALAFGFCWMPNTTFSNANPTTTLTLNQINSQDIGLLFPADARFVIFESSAKMETPLYDTTGGYDPASTLKIASRSTTVLTLSEALDVTNFSATTEIYQVDGFKPLAVDDGLIADVIGARGYSDSGIRIRTDSSGNIYPFSESFGQVYYDNGSGSADFSSIQGHQTITASTSFVNYRLTYCPPDKGSIFISNGSTSSVFLKRYYQTYGQVMLSENGGYENLMKSEMLSLHGILCIKTSAVNTLRVRGYFV